MACKRKDMRKWEDGLGTVHHVSSCLDVARPECSLNLKGTLGCAGKKMTMKKLMITATAALCATVGFSAITSANVVGYNSVKQVKGGKMNLLCVSWATVGNKEGKATLNDVMDTKKLTSYSADGETAGDYIDTWDMEAGNWGKTYYYVDLADSWGAEYADTWVDVDLAPVNPTVDSGTAFWLYANNDIADFAFNGQVVSGELAYTLTAGKMNLCANPFPAALNLNDKSQVVVTGATSYSADGATAGDYIDTWDLATANWGKTYYYVDQAEAWGDPMYADTWVDVDLVPVETTAIGIGSGFWYNAKGNATLTFANPVKKQ